MLWLYSHKKQQTTYSCTNYIWLNYLRYNASRNDMVEEFTLRKSQVSACVQDKWVPTTKHMPCARASDVCHVPQKSIRENISCISGQ